MALLGITIGTSPTPSGKPEYMVATVPFTITRVSFADVQPEAMDEASLVTDLNQLALVGWRVVTCVRMTGFLVYTLFRIAP